jgi:hypothetical protein
MIGITFYLIGFLAALAGYLFVRLSQTYHIDLVTGAGYLTGVFLILLCVFWSVGSVLEGVPRAAAMGMVFFGMPGIVLLFFTARRIATTGKRVS